ncbi:Ypt/Rab-GAP domain of gyp1p superfamily protein isoform 6 [Tripterygium wilfordii]|uniref:Ypt/Rab-GAP domain of gyp1p superfamily protein isoform 6 n=1 Tax=Tripterygium wilfordii TaxID=458696 RepID=A0A7J7DTB1_TRIWF|nr:Ypt/Rab-GAP domain of gyp1p superfamily protein isoform 6 [Tripterygium wilfordii]
MKSWPTGFDEEVDEISGSENVFECGEELEIIQPNGFGSGDGDSDETINGGSDREVRPRPDKDGSAFVSVKKVIAADEKRSDLEYELSQKEINLEKLQRIASTGLPDGGSIRATAWKLLLGFLPPSHDMWEKELDENRQKYAKLKEELLLTPTVRPCKDER